MKGNLPFLYLFCILTLSISLNVARADLNDDKLIERAMRPPIQMTGNLEEIVKKNTISIDANTKTLDAVWARMGLDPKKVSVVEGFAIMRWSVKRIRVSKKYEILVQFGVNANGIEEVISASVIPHVERLFRHNLSNQKNWSKVKYTKETEK